MLSSVSSAQPKLPANFFDLPTRVRLRAAKQVNQLWFVYMCQNNGLIFVSRKLKSRLKYCCPCLFSSFHNS